MGELPEDGSVVRLSRVVLESMDSVVDVGRINRPSESRVGLVVGPSRVVWFASVTDA